MPYLHLLLAILCEVIATSFLKSSAGFTRPLPSVVVLVGYIGAFYFLSLTLRSVPVGVAYAIWSGVGTLLIVLVGWIWLGQRLGGLELVGIGLIVVGAMVLNMAAKVGG